MRSLVHTVQACQPATLSAQIYASGIPTHSIARDSAIELWVDGVRRFAGTIPKRPRTGYDAQGSYIDLNAVDLLARLRSITYERPILSWTGLTAPAPAEWGFPDGMVVPLYRRSSNWTSTVGLFSSGDTYMGTDEVGDLYAIRSSSSSAAELARLVAFLSTRAGITLEIGTLAGLPSKNTGDVVTDLDCLSAVQRCANLRPDAVFWVDPSAGTNRLNYITRDHCTEVTLDCASRDRITANECAPRDDLQLGYIHWTLRWEVVRSDGSWYPNSHVYEYGDSTCPPERRIIRTFHLGKFADSTATTGLPYVWELPTGAAAAYWAAASVLHYEGQCSVYEPDGVSYAYSLGQVLNFSNWQPGYETARALVRGVTYDLVARRTSISFGPPDSLTPQDYLSIAASSLGASSPATSPTDPTTDPSDPSAPGSGDLPAQVTGMLYEKFAVESTTGTVQTIEGTATLGGYSEFSPSAPPKKFLRKKAVETGSYTCIDGHESYSLAATGLYSWSGATLTGPTETGDANILGSSNGNRYCPCGNPCPDFVKTSTTARADVVPGSYSATGLCCGSGYPMQWHDGYHLATLDMEDTEQAAIARLGDTWADPVGTGEKKTFYEQRTIGFSFAVRRCRLHGYTWTCSIYGLPVKISIPLYKYAIGGTKPSTPTATQEIELPLVQIAETTTGAHGLSLTVYKGKATLPDWELPIEQGYVIEAGSISITLL